MKPLDMIPLASGRADFVEKWAASCRQAQNDQDAWIEALRAQGIKAAHPDDGWVDRKRNAVHFAYPQFYDGVAIGDRIALGWADKWRVVEVTGNCGLCLERWLFKRPSVPDAPRPDKASSNPE